MSKKKLLAILGGPHKTGRTAKMLDCAVESALNAGWQVDLVDLYEKNIAYCNGCRTCLVTKKCVQNDELYAVAELLKSCDVIVLAAPTYWANVPATVKNLFDRLLGVAMEETQRFPKPLLSKKQKYLLLTSCKTQFPFSWIFDQSRGTLRAMNEFFKTSGMKCIGRIACAGQDNKNEVPKKTAKRIARYWR